MNRWVVREKKAEWRNAGRVLALEAKIPLLENVHVIITPYHKDRRWVADTGNIYPAYKSFQDGIKDAKIILDDTPDIVVEVTFKAPIIGFGDALEMEIIGDIVENPVIPLPPRKKPKSPYNNGRKARAKRKPC